MISLKKRDHPSLLMSYTGPIIALLLAILLGGLIFLLMGLHPLKTLQAFFISPIRDGLGLSELIIKATPIIICALGLSFCFRANQWNIGAEGQLLCGAMSASATALYFIDNEAGYVIYLVILAGILAGMAWASIPALLKIKLNTNEILTSLMLTYIAVQLLQFLVYGPLKDPDGFGFPESKLFSDNALLKPIIEGTRLHQGVILAPILTAMVYFIFHHHLLGYRIKLTGIAPAAAKHAGFNQRAIVWLVFLASGALAGLAGALEVTGLIGQLVPSVSPGYGFTAIIVVFLGRLNPIGIFIAGFVIALTYLGGETLQIVNIDSLKLSPDVSISSIPKAVGEVFQGAVLFFLLMTEVFVRYKLTFNQAKQSVSP